MRKRVLNEVRSQVDQISSFPETIEAPDYRQIVFRAPAIQVAILGPPESPLTSFEQDRKLRELAEEAREEILQLPAVPAKNWFRRLFQPMISPPGKSAVSEAEIVAARDYQINVEISESRLRDYRLSLEQVAAAIKDQNIDLPGGKMVTQNQELLLRSNNKRETGAEIEPITILSRPNGDVVTVGQLGNVVDGFSDDVSEHRVDGRPARVIAISKTANEDMFTVVEAVLDYVANKKMPAGYEIKCFQDMSLDVRDRIELLSRNGLQGLILVFLVLAIFLDLRLAFWVALGIPVSILGAGFVLLISGQTLNMLSMFAFLMALGIVVDDAIVIGENIYAKRQEGLSGVRAAVAGTIEVLPSVCASVTTTIIAFLPLMFVSGVMGKFLAVMPLAVIAMLIISLIESTFILPSHLAHENNLFLRSLSVGMYVFKFLLLPLRWIHRGASSAMQATIEKFYVPFLTFSLSNKRIVLSSAIGIIFLAIGFILSGITPFEFFPKLDSRVINGKVVFPDGTSEIYTKDCLLEMEQTLRRVDQQIIDETGKSAISLVYRQLGYAGRAGDVTSVFSGSHVGTVQVELVTTAERDITSQEIIDRWRSEMPEVPGYEILQFAAVSMGPGGNEIEFKLLAAAGSEQYLENIVEECKAYLNSKVGVTDIQDDSRVGKWEMRIRLNKQGTALGLNESNLARTLRATYYGQEADRPQRGRHEVKVMVRYPKKERSSKRAFDEIMIRDNQGLERSLKDVARVNYVRASSEIDRLNQKRAITITADVDKSQGANAAQIVAEMKNEFIPQLLESYKAAHGAKLYVNWEGQQQQNQESMSSMGVGFIIALFGMFILLTLEFRSYVQPLIIMAIIPFGIIGAIFGHAVMGLPFTLFSFFGMIALTGVVVNDSIVLVDFINSRVRSGMELNEALIEAGRRRFRPIMLTSFTTIAGLFPMLLERSFQAQVLIPMAASIIFGLMLGTLFILVLVPIFYRIYASILATFGMELVRNEDDEEQSPSSTAQSMPSPGGANGQVLVNGAATIIPTESAPSSSVLPKQNDA